MLIATKRRCCIVPTWAEKWCRQGIDLGLSQSNLRGLIKRLHDFTFILKNSENKSELCAVPLKVIFPYTLVLTFLPLCEASWMSSTTMRPSSAYTLLRMAGGSSNLLPFNCVSILLSRKNCMGGEDRMVTESVVSQQYFFLREILEQRQQCEQERYHGAETSDQWEASQSLKSSQTFWTPLLYGYWWTDAIQE